MLIASVRGFFSTRWQEAETVMTMAPTTETVETGEEQERQPDPAEVRAERLERQLGEVTTSNQRLQNQIGYLTRQVSDLKEKPQTPDSRAELAELREMLADTRRELRLRDMTDEEKVAFLEEERRRDAQKPAPKPAEAAKPAEPLTRQQEDANAQIARIYNDHYYPALAERSAQQGVELAEVVKRADWPTDITRFDSWAVWRAAANAVIDKAGDEALQGKRRAPATDGQRGTSTNPGNDVDGYRKRLREGGALPSADEIDRLTARYLS